MFHSAKLRLTLGYLAVIMLVSISFSAVIYNVSIKELDKGLRHQTTFVIQNGPFPIINGERFETARQEQYEASTHRLILQLAFVNTAMLVVGGLFSYWLAKRSLDPLEEAIETQIRFTGDAAHELRTPLTAMKTEIEVNLRDKNLTLKDAKSVLASNIEEIDKLEALTNALLRLAKNERMNTEAWQRVSLASAVHSAWKRIAADAKTRRIKLDAAGADDVEVFGDHDQIVELFVILFDNAVKYGRDNTLVTVQAGAHDGQVTIKVADQGQGISAEDIEHIFERFYRADQSRTKNTVPGYGLGLSLAERIVQSHGGRIRVASEPGVGTTFTFGLPRAHEVVSEAGKNEAEAA